MCSAVKAPATAGALLLLAIQSLSQGQQPRTGGGHLQRARTYRAHIQPHAVAEAAERALLGIQ